jgi:tRNA-2-methylthio-N6-dimethylallyladenosine synthase
MERKEKTIVSVKKVSKDWMEQQPYMNKLRQLSDEFYEKNGRRKKHLTVTFGCQMNENDSEKMIGMLSNLGYEETDKKEEADIILFNTCLIRENAELKVYGNLGALKPLKKKNPNLIIGVCGCMMQKEHIRQEILTKYKHVDLVFGTHNYHTLPKLIHQIEVNHERVFDVWEDNDHVVEALPVNRKFKFKAFLDIMYGCNNFCTYCVVPYTRGREKSRDAEDILEEVTQLVADGYKEVTLLGQNVNSYGKNLETPVSFAELLDRMAQIPGLRRIRFMTSHPKDLSFELLEVMAKHDNICKQLHLPVQSGSDTVLKRMNRHYDRDRYMSIVKRAKELMPDVAISTDIIVGFPGETEEDFNDTMSLVEEVKYDSAFTFLYSIREGTPAAKMDDQVPDDVKHARFDRLLDVVKECTYEGNRKYVGRTVEVLVEGLSKNDKSILSGRTGTNKLVQFSGEEKLIGEIVKVKILEAKNFNLKGELI